MDMTILSLLLLFTAVKVVSSSHLQTILQTTTGFVRGTSQHILHKQVDAYLGIPYATPPIGELRFRKPRPVQRWHGIYNATTNPMACIQTCLTDFDAMPDNENVSEDCLYLNVWVPRDQEVENHNKRLLPIMVWIYGGGFSSGSISLDVYDGGVLAAYGNVIVASMNYRMGALGFMSIGTEDAPGNMGMFDQVLALQWIKDNAEELGGDPNKITLFGQSAGSMSVGMHLLSPLSRGLFTRAIMQSGSPAFSPIINTTQEEGAEIANRFAKLVGCSNESCSFATHPDKIMSCLRRLEPKDFVIPFNMSSDVYFMPRYGDDYLPFSPVDIIHKGIFLPADVLLGTTSNEGSLFVYFFLSQERNISGLPELTLAEGEDLIRKVFQPTYTVDPDAIVNYYLNGIQEGEYERIIQAVSDSIGDIWIVCNTMYFAEAFSMKDSSVYMYNFNYTPSNSPWDPWMAVAHSEDVQFVFGVPLRNSSYTERERDLSRFIMDKWTGFAKTGNPYRSQDEAWPTYNIEDHTYLQLRPGHYVTGTGPNLEHCNFWREYMPQPTLNTVIHRNH